MGVQVLVDGCDVKDMDLKSLRDRVGLVSQEPVLFSCSVHDNICYGNPDATHQQVEAAAQAANAHSFIQKLPEGYSTQVQLLRVICLSQQPHILLLWPATSPPQTPSPNPPSPLPRALCLHADGACIKVVSSCVRTILTWHGVNWAELKSHAAASTTNIAHDHYSTLQYLIKQSLLRAVLAVMKLMSFE